MKAIIISAPSGAGKTTIVSRLMKRFPQLGFSVSACSRPIRGSEVDGRDYYFLSPDDFRKRVAQDEFVEWEEVYPDNYYGTLKSELEKIWKAGKVPLFDVDVIGGLNLKNHFGDSALSLFIQPPSLQILTQRLRNRGTDDEESLKQRLLKAELEMTYAPRFDHIVVNDDLTRASEEVEELIDGYLRMKIL
jgi:guanylate kinase